MNKLLTIIFSMAFVCFLFFGVTYGEQMVDLHLAPRIIYIFPMAMSFASGMLISILLLTDIGK